MRSPDRLFPWPLAAALPLVALMLSSTSLAQGVPVFDPVKNAKEAEITAQMEADLALQRQKAEEADRKSVV